MDVGGNNCTWYEANNDPLGAHNMDIFSVMKDPPSIIAATVKVLVMVVSPGLAQMCLFVVTLVYLMTGAS